MGDPEVLHKGDGWRIIRREDGAELFVFGRSEAIPVSVVHLKHLKELARCATEAASAGVVERIARLVESLAVVSFDETEETLKRLAVTIREKFGPTKPPWNPPSEPPAVANYYLCALRGGAIDRLHWMVASQRWNHPYDNSGSVYWTNLVIGWRELPEGPTP